MPKSIISEGRTTNEAISKGLKELNCKEEDVEIKVLENEEKKAFFSILYPRVVKVELIIKEGKESEKKSHPIEKKNPSKEDIDEFKKSADDFLKKFSDVYKNISYTISDNAEGVNIVIDGEDASRLIGHRGDTINALQTIISSIGNRNTKVKVRDFLDIEGYREKREQTLKELADKLEKTVKRTGKKVMLEPMSAYERKVIHTRLQDSKFVTTYSIGEEPRRKVVIEKK